MSRHGYSDDGWDDPESQWASIRYQGALKSAIRGRRGQAFLRELEEALLALPEKRLVEGDFIRPGTGEACALGSVALKRARETGKPVEEFTPAPMTEDEEYNGDSERLYTEASKKLGITETLAREVMYQNDDDLFGGSRITPEERYERVLRWVREQIKREPEPAGSQGGGHV